MCGIVGYVGGRQAAGVVLSGLQRLEYRGYDSAGVGLVTEEGGVEVVKTPGKIADLEALIGERPGGIESLTGTTGIGHTRWATHGEPNRANAHPHLSRNGEFAVVHNGIVENYGALKARLEQDGYVFAGETDSEVIAHLIEASYKGNLSEAVMAALAKLEGTYGIAVISARHPETVVAARKGSPIVVGLCDDVITVPGCAEFLAPVPAVVAAQLFAYHVARELGRPIDQPRNLAKSVTVE